MNDLRAQLAPGWSGVNVALTVLLFLMAWPLGLLMVAYIVWGRQLGLDLSRPETLSLFGGRVRDAWRAGSASWGQGRTPLSTGTPRGSSNVSARSNGQDEATALRAERDALDRERHAFEVERREWRDRHGASARETLDS